MTATRSKIALVQSNIPPQIPGDRNAPRIYPWQLVALALLVSVCFVFDEQLAALVCATLPSGTGVHRLFKLPKWALNGWTLAILLIPLALHPRRKQMLIAYSATVGACVAVLHLTKFVLGRARPDLGLGPFTFDFFGDGALGYDAFPSGHTTQAFLVALLAGIYFPRTRGVLVVLATMVAISRVAQERHFPSDVAAGVTLAALAVALGTRIFGRAAFPTITANQLSAGFDELRSMFANKRIVTQRPFE